MHGLIRLLHVVQLRVGLHLVSQHGIAVFCRDPLALLGDELLAVFNDLVPLAQAQRSVGQQAQEAGLKLGILMEQPSTFKHNY